MAGEFGGHAVYQSPSSFHPIKHLDTFITISSIYMLHIDSQPPSTGFRIIDPYEMHAQLHIKLRGHL